MYRISVKYLSQNYLKQEKMPEKKIQFRPFMRQCLVTAAVSSNMIGFGCYLGFPGILLPQLQRASSAISVSKDQASWLASAGSFPMIVGNFLVPALTTRAGRKAALYLTTLVKVTSWLVVILAPSYEMLLFGRILAGLSFGMFMPLRSIFVAECTSPRYRGGFLSVTELAQTLGLCFVHLVGSLTSYQLTSLCCIAFPFISVLLVIYSPESPSWLATKGKYDECRNNFIWLRGEEETKELDNLIDSVKYSEAQPRNEQSKLREITAVAKKKEFYKPIFIMFALYIMLTYAGGPVMGAYSVTVLERLMGPEVNPHFWMVALDFQRLLFSVVAIFSIHKVKRRTMLFIVGALCAGSQLMMGVYLFSRKENILPFNSLWIPGILINVQMMTTSMGMQPLPAVISGEVFPLQHRSLAGSIGLMAQCLSIFIVLKSFPSVISAIDLEGAFLLYSGMITACLAVAWVMLPETSGRTLQQIEEHFRGSPLVDPEADVRENKLLDECGKQANGETVLKI